MKQEYCFNSVTRFMWPLLGAGIFFALQVTYKSGEISKFIFFLIGVPLCIFITIVVWGYKISLNKESIFSFRPFGKHRTYRWGQINEIRDDSFAIFHLYWLLTSDLEIKLSGWKGLTLTNFGISKYRLLLANIINHISPQSIVSDSILTHLNLSKNDIGKYYGTDQWIDMVSVKSYWTQK